MGAVDSIKWDKWPKQGRFLNLRVVVCFHYDTAYTIGGVVVRDDAEEPGQMLIRLDDGRIVRSVECMYTLPTPATAAREEGERGH